MGNKKTESKSERIFIVAGLGDIGSAFARGLSKEGSVYGISRNPKGVGLTRFIRANLLNKDDVREAFRTIPVGCDIIYLHLVGKFVFQDENHSINDENKDGIDDDTYLTNVETFRNVRPHLTQYLLNNPSSKLKAVGIGSTSDIYDIPFWHSYTYSKNELRKELRLFYGNPQTFGRASTLLINVSTVSGEQLSTERPYISREFCLTPEEVVKSSLDCVLDSKTNCIEMTLVKPNPEFLKADFWSDSNVRKRWYKDMKGGDEIR